MTICKEPMIVKKNVVKHKIDLPENLDESGNSVTNIIGGAGGTQTVTTAVLNYGKGS